MDIIAALYLQEDFAMTFSNEENGRCFPCAVYKTDYPLCDPDSVISHPIHHIPTFKTGIS